MNKYEYYVQACKAGTYKRRNWVFSVFTLTQEGAEAWKSDPYDWRLVQTPTGFFYVDPQSKELTKIDGGVTGEPLLTALDGIDLKAGDFVSVKKDMRVSAGNLLFNLCALIPAFGDKIEFISGPVNVMKIEGIIAQRLQNTPGQDVVRDPTLIYVDEYIKFCDSFTYLTEFNQIFTVALTKKAVTQAPGTIELRNKLLKENKDHLDDPLVVAKIEAALIEHDGAYLKGDPSEKFLISGKSRQTVRRKLFLDYGSDPGLTKTFKANMVPKSLSEGWDTNNMPAMINASRAGSFYRGAETALGGEATKWLYRASSNINILDQDCGSRLGFAMSINDYNVSNLVKMRVITQSSTKLVNDIDEAESYLGKRLMIRSPLYCNLDKTNYCRWCVGEKLGLNTNSAASAISKLGSLFLSLSLSAFHAKTVKMNTTSLDEIMS